MQIDALRALKAELIEGVIAPLIERALADGALAMSTRPLAMSAVPRTLALGVARGRSARDFRLAVRVQRIDGGPFARLEPLISARARREVDIRFVGPVYKGAALPWQRLRQRPLAPGMSIGHEAVTAGTLGAIVVDARGVGYALSNNHVIANEDRARRGDAVLQPGALDGGAAADEVATVARAVRLKRGRAASAANRVDAALAVLNDGIANAATSLRGLGVLRGLAETPLMPGAKVAKLGRTSGLTRGVVSAIEVDQVMVGFDFGNARFDGQIEIEGEGAEAFSAGGDSGALIVDAERRAIGLLFAGSDFGGRNRRGLTYANPIAAVLSALKVRLG